MQTTTHYALQKPETNDTFNPMAVTDSNMDAIDAQMYANAQAAAAAQTAATNAQTTANAAVPSSQKGVANGVATTDANNRVVQTANNSLQWNGANRTAAGAAPATPNPGDEWYNTTTNRKLYWNGTAWIDPLKYL